MEEKHPPGGVIISAGSSYQQRARTSCFLNVCQNFSWIFTWASAFATSADELPSSFLGYKNHQKYWSQNIAHVTWTVTIIINLQQQFKIYKNPKRSTKITYFCSPEKLMLLVTDTNLFSEYYCYHYLIHSLMQIEDSKTPRLSFVWADTWEGNWSNSLISKQFGIFQTFPKWLFSLGSYFWTSNIKFKCCQMPKDVSF